MGGRVNQKAEIRKLKLGLMGFAGESEQKKAKGAKGSCGEWTVDCGEWDVESVSACAKATAGRLDSGGGGPEGRRVAPDSS